MRKTFHKQLNAIIENVISMRSLSQHAVYNAIEALVEMNSEFADQINEIDNAVDDL
jgi:phosphate uptake regulator